MTLDSHADTGLLQLGRRVTFYLAIAEPGVRGEVAGTYAQGASSPFTSYPMETLVSAAWEKGTVRVTGTGYVYTDGHSLGHCHVAYSWCGCR